MAKQPPPLVQRKAKHVNILKSVLTEQSSKLQQKQQLEHELLEDVKNYSKTRASIEKDYGQALQKLAAQFSSKFMPKDENEESKSLSRTPFGLWRKVLEETEATAIARIALSQDIIANVTENVKVLKSVRAVTTKSCNALAEKLQEELQESVQELSKSQKTYADLYKLVVQAREQAEGANEKLKKGQLKFFQTKARVEKNASKTQERLALCEKRVAMMRNEYILNLAAVNAHHQRYYSTDLPELIALQDGNIYEKFKDYFKSLTTLEADTCARSEREMRRLREEASQLQRAYAMQLFLRLNPAFTKCLTYEFQPCDGDQVQTLSQDHGAGHHLSKEARKWALRLAKAQRTIRKKSNELQNYERSTSSSSDKLNQAEGTPAEQSKDALMEDIRHSEIVKMKAEARLDVLREAGVNVDEWLQSATSENGEDEDNNNEQENDQSDFEDDLNDWDDEDDVMEAEFSDDDQSTSSTQSHRLLQAVALYSFQAASREELSIQENEELEIIERDVDGWCKGRNKAGQSGYIPEAYVDIIPKEESKNRSAASSTSSSSGKKAVKETASKADIAASVVEPEALFFAKALYDYTAMEEEELTFKEGDIIKVTSKDNNGVDDGWWEGYLNGIKGAFPSIVVEQIQDPKPRVDDWAPFERRRINTDTFTAMPKAKMKLGRRTSES